MSYGNTQGLLKYPLATIILKFTLTRIITSIQKTKNIPNEKKVVCFSPECLAGQVLNPPYNSYHTFVKNSTT